MFKMLDYYKMIPNRREDNSVLFTYKYMSFPIILLQRCYKYLLPKFLLFTLHMYHLHDIITRKRIWSWDLQVTAFCVKINNEKERDREKGQKPKISWKDAVERGTRLCFIRDPEF